MEYKLKFSTAQLRYFGSVRLTQSVFPAFSGDHVHEIYKNKSRIGVIPLATCLDIFADEKVCLKQEDKLIPDFDLLIGATAIANNMILVTRNVQHLERLNNLKIENCVSPPDPRRGDDLALL